mgnify:CR=1 FL=1
MKNINSTFIVDEMIEKLTEIKKSQSEQFVVEQLRVIRAYCDLLIKSYELHSNHVESVQKHAPTPATPQKTVTDMLENEELDSIFDF